MRAKPALPLLAALAVLVASGCGPAIQRYQSAQGAPGETVTVSARFCEDSGQYCSTLPLGTHGYQLLAAFAVPRDAHVERVVTTGTFDLTLVESESFRRSLEQTQPLADGRRWVAYRSDELPAAAAGADPVWTVAAEIDPPGRSGTPTGTLPVRLMLGYRHLGGGLPADAPIDCAVITCDGIGRELDGNRAALDVPFQIRDVGLAAGERASVDRGAPGQVPFTVRYGGGTHSGDMPWSASTTIPGATATVDPVKFTSTRASSVPVTVSVPETTAPGDYEVTLNVATRTLTVPVRVDAPPRPVADVASIEFAETRVGKEQVARNVLVRNAGTRALDMRSSALSGPQAAEFGIVADECAGRSLAPGAGCIVAVHFVPRDGGTRSATLRVATGYTDLEVPLTGVGAAIPAHKGVMQLLGAAEWRTASRRELLQRGGLVFAQTFAMAGDAAWRLRLDGLRIGRVVEQRVATSGEQVVRIPLTKRGRRLLERRPGGRIVLTTALTDVDGRRSVVRRSVGFAQG